MRNEHVVEKVLFEVRGQITAQLPKRDAQLSEMEAELRNLRVEQQRLAKAVALADDVPELVTELRRRACASSTSGTGRIASLGLETCGQRECGADCN
jgi:hypothetical protein